MVALGEYSGMAVKLAVSFLTNALSALSWKEPPASPMTSTMWRLARA